MNERRGKKTAFTSPHFMISSAECVEGVQRRGTRTGGTKTGGRRQRKPGKDGKGRDGKGINGKGGDCKGRGGKVRQGKVDRFPVTKNKDSSQCLRCGVRGHRLTLLLSSSSLLSPYQ